MAESGTMSAPQLTVNRSGNFESLREFLLRQQIEVCTRI